MLSLLASQRHSTAGVASGSCKAAAEVAAFRAFWEACLPNHGPIKGHEVAWRCPSARHYLSSTLIDVTMCGRVLACRKLIEQGLLQLLKVS